MQSTVDLKTLGTMSLCDKKCNIQHFECPSCVIYELLMTEIRVTGMSVAKLMIMTTDYN